MTGRLEMKSLESRDPRIACGGDEAFALPIAVTLRSAIDRLARDRRLGVYLLDAGIGAKSRARIEASLPLDRIALEWVKLEIGLLESLPVSGHVSLATYSRLLLPRVVPDSLERILYLDSDLVVCADLSELWDASLGENLALAVQEVAAPFFDNKIAIPDFDRYAAFFDVTRPIENYRALGLDPAEPYFNGGVMSIDLARWRAESIADECFMVLSKHEEHVLYWDQYALNIVLAGRWGRLPERWNSSSHLMAIPEPSQCIFSADAFEASVSDPAIIHFTGPTKPWHPRTRRDLPRAHVFDRVRRETAWRGLPWYALLLRLWLRGAPRALKKGLKRLKQKALAKR